MAKHEVNYLPTDDIIINKGEIPFDYHEDDDALFRTAHYCGELKTLGGKYYSNLVRRKYYHPDERKQHLAVGHVVGYRWALQNLIDPGSWVLDPTCGSGPALVDAYNNRRHSVGVELEYHHVALQNLTYQTERNPQHGTNFHVYNGSILQEDILKHHPVKKFNLIINGPPYPILHGSNLSSDVHESTWERENMYKDSSNLGMMRDGPVYWDNLKAMYQKCYDMLDDDGFLCILIKDPISNKKYYPLTEKVGRLLESIGFYLESTFLHKHIPSTLFMHTYPKKFPGVKMPLYQAGTIFQKDIDR